MLPRRPPAPATPDRARALDLLKEVMRRHRNGGQHLELNAAGSLARGGHGHRSHHCPDEPGCFSAGGRPRPIAPAALDLLKEGGAGTGTVANVSMELFLYAGWSNRSNNHSYADFNIEKNMRTINERIVNIPKAAIRVRKAELIDSTWNISLNMGIKFSVPSHTGRNSTNKTKIQNRFPKIIFFVKSGLSFSLTFFSLSLISSLLLNEKISKVIAPARPIDNATDSAIVAIKTSGELVSTITPDCPTIKSNMYSLIP
ncbi:hypothetical protein C8D72_3495 [Kushneria indalinina DSM 14324]|uniref:Uncharacterized protein n=1 Tax=Kushneria indalinina DSM 14324 TaxID=1122140 RepID=A0A3D9DRM9_9GAMM|nr:hypothetical protein C8D72_3495 [Kushneria indalinina DSM 14324]